MKMRFASLFAIAAIAGLMVSLPSSAQEGVAPHPQSFRSSSRR